MLETFCPCCGEQRMVPLGEPNFFTCLACCHVFEIRDVIGDAAAKAGMDEHDLYSIVWRTAKDVKRSFPIGDKGVSL